MGICFAFRVGGVWEIALIRVDRSMFNVKVGGIWEIAVVGVDGSMFSV